MLFGVKASAAASAAIGRNGLGWLTLFADLHVALFAVPAGLHYCFSQVFLFCFVEYRFVFGFCWFLLNLVVLGIDSEDLCCSDCIVVTFVSRLIRNSNVICRFL